MRILRRSSMAAVVVAIGLSSLLMSSSSATATNPSQQGRVTVADRADGMTGQQLVAQAWISFYETPTTAPPVPCFYLGRTGQVLLAGNGRVVCQAKLGTPVMYFFGASCDNVSQPPDFGVTQREQRLCALAANKRFLKSMALGVDGGPTVKISRDRFLTCTGQHEVQLPADNIDGVPAGPATFVACVYAAFVDHLSLGRHTTNLDVEFTDGGTDSIVRTIEVVR